MPIKLSHWKQDTPKMQLASIGQSIENNLANMREGVGGVPYLLMAIVIQKLSNELIHLAPFLLKDEWGKDVPTFKVGGWYRHLGESYPEDLMITKISNDMLFFNDMSHTKIKEDMSWLVPIEDPK